MESRETELNKLQNKLMRRAKRIGLDVTEEDISDEITDAINFVNNRRGFIPTSSCLYEERFSSIIVDLALNALTKYGAEGEISSGDALDRSGTRSSQSGRISHGTGAKIDAPPN